MSRLSASRKAAADHVDPLQPGLSVHSMPGHIVRRLQQVAVRLFTEEVGADLTPVQFASLYAVADKPNIGQAALAALIGYDRATIGGVIDRLEQKGLIKRVPSPDDRRSNALALTQAGRELLVKAEPRVRAVQARLLEPLDADELSVFTAMCQRILRHHNG